MRLPGNRLPTMDFRLKKLRRFKMIGAFTFPAAPAHMRGKVLPGFGINVSAKSMFMMALRAAVAAGRRAVWFKDVSIRWMHGDNRIDD